MPSLLQLTMYAIKLTLVENNNTQDICSSDKTARTMLKNTPFIIKSIGLILIYIIAAKISLSFATVSGSATLIWIPGGIALAIVFLGGKRYLAAVFIGALITSIIIHNPWVINLGTAIGNTLEVYIAYTLLYRYGDFDRELSSTKDFFVLITLGGMISTLASAILGPLSLLAAGYISSDMLLRVTMGWWRADVLGIVFFTPITLLLLQKKAFFTYAANAFEKLSIWLISFIIGQMILVGWIPPTDIIDKPHGTAWIFLLLLWASIRTGRRNTALLQLMFLTQGLASAYFNVGLFADDFLLYGLINFWVFAMLLATAGMMMAILNLENSNAFTQIKLVNDQLRTMMEAIPDAIFFKDGQGRWLVVNETGKKLFNLNEVSWEGKTEKELAEMHPKYHDAHVACLVGDNQAWDAKELSLFNETVIDDDGISHHYDVRKMPIFSQNGDRQSLVIIARDITQDKIAKAALRDSELRWKFAVEGSDSGMWEYNFQTQTNVASKHLMEILGFTVTDSESNYPLNDWVNRLHPESKPATMDAFQAVADNKSDQYVVEQQVLCEDGSYKWLFTRGMVVDRNDHGMPLLMIGTSIDVTERYLAKEKLLHDQARQQLEIQLQNNELRQAQSKLSASHDRYQDLYDFSPTGYLTITAQGIISEINLKAAKMLAFNRIQLIDRRFDQFVVEEDKVRWQSLLLSRISKEKNDDEHFELKFIRSDGLPFFANLNCIRIKTSNEQPVLRIALTDITKLKQSETALRIAAIAFESQEGMFVTDANSIILQVNKAFTTITGYSAEDVIGQKPSKLSSGRHNADFYARMWSCINRTGGWQGEIWNKRKHGDIYPEQLTITAVIDEYRQVTNYVATMIDITASKDLEAQRIADEKSLRDVLVREVHHRIKNNLQGVAGLLRNTAELNPTLIEPLNAAISQVYSISVIHGLQGQNSMLNIPLCELCREIAVNNEPLWRTPIKVNIPENMPLFQIAETEAVPIALILNELISNAVKHGEKKMGVSITLRLLPNSESDITSAEVRIINIGTLASTLDTSMTAMTGTGLQLVKSLLPFEGATLTLEQHENEVHTTLVLTQPVILATN